MGPERQSRKRQQVNLQISGRLRDVLDTVAVIRRTTATEVLYPVVEAFLEEQSERPRIKRILQDVNAGPNLSS